jgi:hypothetical protein
MSQNKKGSMIQLTDYCDPTEFIRCQYGSISWKRYLNLEKERIEKSPGRVAEIRHGVASAGNKYALFVNDIGLQIVNGNYESRTFEP